MRILEESDGCFTEGVGKGIATLQVFDYRFLARLGPEKVDLRLVCLRIGGGPPGSLFEQSDDHTGIVSLVNLVLVARKIVLDVLTNLILLLHDLAYKSEQFVFNLRQVFSDF